MALFSKSELACYRERGFLVCRGLLSAEVIEPIRRRAEALLTDPLVSDPNNMRCRFHEHRQTGQLLLEAIDPVLDLAPEIAALTQGPLLRQAVEELLGEPSFLFKDKLIFKQPGSSGYGLHQDYIAWPEFPKSCTLVLVAIDASNAENGCLEMYPGGHKLGYLAPTNGAYHGLHDRTVRDLPHEAVPLEPGDVMIFHCLIPHRSQPNRSSAPRRHLYLNYNGLSDGGEQRDRYYRLHWEWYRKAMAERGQDEMYYR